jgi:citrate lyase subunit beta/citryl-CoA lyase
MPSNKALQRLIAARSFLFAPGDSERKLTGALTCGAHAVIADLEDAVAPADKERARAVVMSVLRDVPTSDVVRLVRINCSGDAPLAADVAIAERAGADGIVLPMASVEVLGRLVTSLPVVAIVETARGLRDAYDLARSPGVAAIALGAVDLAAGLGLGTVDGDERELPLLFARSQLVRDCAAAGARAPIDAVHTAVHDVDGLRRSSAMSRALGLRGRLCLHPKQVPVVDEAFAPAPADVAWAQRVVAAYRGAGADGALAIDGEMIDEAVAKRAERILGEAPR